jgi:peptide/nickel transport system permease protein
VSPGLDLSRKLVRLIVVLFLVSTATFLMLDLTPGDPANAVLGRQATPQAIAEIHHELGLDRPLVDRYRAWLGNVFHGDLGRSLVPPKTEVSDRIRDALPVTLELVAVAQLFALCLAVPAGLWAAHRKDGKFDRAVTSVSIMALSVPTFVLSFVLILVFALHWQWFPTAQWARVSEAGLRANLRHVVLPSLALALPEMAMYLQVLRADALATLEEDYIASARAKGLPTRRILFAHVLRPSSFSLVTLFAISVGTLLGASVLVETVFGLPGMGRLLVDSVGKADYPMVQGCVLVISAAYVVLNSLADLAYGWLDPRARVRPT